MASKRKKVKKHYPLRRPPRSPPWYIWSQPGSLVQFRSEEALGENEWRYNFGINIFNSVEDYNLWCDSKKVHLSKYKTYKVEDLDTFAIVVDRYFQNSCCLVKIMTGNILGWVMIYELRRAKKRRKWQWPK